MLARGCILTLLVLALAVPTRADDWIRIEGPEDILRNYPETCPIRFEVPLPGLHKESGRFKTQKARTIYCQGVSVTLLKLSWKRLLPTAAPGPTPKGRQLFVDPEIWVPNGRNLDLTLHYVLLQGEREIAIGDLSFYGDEGEANYEEPLALPLAEGAVRAGEPAPVLRVELTFTQARG
ncbi:MAG TPA: hypothetical protein VF017_18795 [Thermoanaerobaculia bacterium]|nr:hypothetical protein [Thermoanaerobaculia bacterium]